MPVILQRQHSFEDGHFDSYEGGESTAHGFCGHLKAGFKRFYRKLGLKHFLLLFVVAIYTLIGAAIFLAVEYDSDLADHQRDYREYLAYQRQALMRLEDIAKWFRESSRNSAANERLERELLKTLFLYESQLGVSVSNESTWDFWTAMYFSGTIYTSIGYGNVYCKTVPGQLLTMIYAVAGIPLVLSTLNDLGKWLFVTILNSMHLFNKVKTFICCQFVRLRRRLTPGGRRSPAVSNHQLSLPSEQEELTDIRVLSEPMTPKNSVASRVLLDEADYDPNATRRATPTPSEVLGAMELQETAIVADDEDKSEQDLLADERAMPKIPVKVALSVTCGWVLLCAAIFCIWEPWDYFTAVYFFFISLSTIGLGDITPTYPKYMVLNYAFVIIGLSLVSMCISVIQRALEDLYMRILLKILMEYQQQMQADGDKVGATMGMMKSWSSSRSAKYLMPLMSKQKKMSAMQKLHDKADASGIELPPILSNIDARTGLPAIFSIPKQQADAPHEHQQRVEDAIEKADETALQSAPPAPSPQPPRYFYEAHAQTDVQLFDDKQDQTVSPETFETSAQSELSAWNYAEETTQTHFADWAESEAQTASLEQRDDDSQTPVVAVDECEAQTTAVATIEQELQTHLFDLAEADAQTTAVLWAQRSVQTDEVPPPRPPDVEHQACQADLDPPPPPPLATVPEEEVVVARSTKPLDQAKRRIRRAFGKKSTRRQSTPATKSDEFLPEDSDEEDEPSASSSATKSSKESLNWNPIDGLHAEKQRNVSALKKMFDQPSFDHPSGGSKD